MLNFIAVFIGGGIGSLLRYLTGLYLPFPTFVVNIAGSFILGILFGIFVDKPEVNQGLKLALTVGFCGGLTTFSTLSFQLFELIKMNEFVNCLIYAMISLIIGVIAVSAGVYCAKFISI